MSFYSQFLGALQDAAGHLAHAHKMHPAVRDICRGALERLGLNNDGSPKLGYGLAAGSVMARRQYYYGGGLVSPGTVLAAGIGGAVLQGAVVGGILGALL